METQCGTPKVLWPIGRALRQVTQKELRIPMTRENTLQEQIVRISETEAFEQNVWQENEREDL